MNSHQILRAGLLLLSSLLVFATPAKAQDKDMLEIEHYTLSENKLAHFNQLLQDFKAFEKTHPEEKEAIKASLEKDEEKHETIDSIAQRIGGNATVSGMLSKEGFTPHEFVVFEMAFLQAALAASLKPAAEPDAKYCAEVHMNPANLAFVRQHQAELAAMQKSGDHDD